MFGPIRNVVFDFDGTLVDTMPSVVRGLAEAVEFGTGKAVDPVELVKTFGAAPQDVLRRWMPEEKVAGALNYWLDFESKLSPADNLPFAGVPELLEGLKKAGIGLGIFTGRDRAGVRKIAQSHGWWNLYFGEDKAVCGDDGHKTKPHPDALSFLIKSHSWNPSDTLMVGDHPFDMMAGAAAGTKTAAALWESPPPPGSKVSERARFRDSWKRWDDVSCDLRLATPLSLLEWLKS